MAMKKKPNSNKPTWLVTADWHLTLRSQDEYRWTFLEWLSGVIQERNVRRLFLLGDLTDAKDCHSAELVNRIARYFTGLTRSITQDLHIYLLCGNHDYVDKETPFFDFLSEYPNMYFFREPSVLDIDGRSVAFLPHGGDGPQLPKDKKFDFLFMHEIVSGARTGNVELHATASGEVLSRATEVLSGDVHWPQKVGRVTYVGAPYPIVFGDDYTPRVMLRDVESGAWHTLTPPTLRKHVVEARPDQSLKKLLKNAKSGDQLKLRLVFDRRDFDSWNEIRQRFLDEADAMGLSVHGVELLAAEGQEELSQASDGKASTAGSARQQLKRYVKEQKVPSDVAAAGLALLEEVKP